MLEAVERIEETYRVIDHLESLLLLDGYFKGELAALIGTTIDRIENFMTIPHEANPHERWCKEVYWLYKSRHDSQNSYTRSRHKI